MPLYNPNGVVQQVVGNSATPSLVLGGAAGTSPSASIVGTNMSGKVTLNTGTGILGSGTVMTMTFANGFAYPNGCVVSFAAGNSNFAAVVSTIYLNTTTTTVTVLVAAGLTLSTTYIGFYTITGY